MAIRLDPETVDAQGFPVVTWEEDRNIFAPDGLRRARVSCFIRPDAKGELQFVSVGAVRHGSYEEARSWAQLVSFVRESAEQLYYSAGDKALIEVVTSRTKSSAARLLATDGAHVMVANFRDERPGVPMHLNCAECTPVETVLLHDRLHRAFITKREFFREELGGELLWPAAKSFTAYVPPAPPSVPGWLRAVIDIAIVAGMALIGWGIYNWFG